MLARAVFTRMHEGFIRSKGPAVQKVPGFFGGADMDGNHIGPGKKLIQGNESDPRRRGRTASGWKVQARTFMPMPFGQRRHLPADAAEADDPQSFAVELGHGDPGPPSRLQLLLVLGDFAGGGQHQSQGVLGHGHGRISGRIRHLDAAAGGGTKIDVVGPDAEDGDHLQIRAGLEEGVR